MITYEWQIKHDPEREEGLRAITIGRRKNVIVQIDFALIARDANGNEGRVDGAYSPATDELGSDFVTFSKVTSEMIIKWLDASPMAAVYKEEAASRIAPASQIILPPWIKPASALVLSGDK